MLISILRYIRGYLRIRIVGCSPERFLNLCSHHQIYLWGLEPCAHAYEMYISVKGFRKLKPIIKKTKTKVTILKRYGLPFFLHKYRKRKMFFLGTVICILLIYTMSLFIWNIHIDGNYSRTDETILAFLKKEKIIHGMKKSSVDCDRIVKDIRKEFDDIIWVSASVRGTRLMIQVKENSDTPPVDGENQNQIEARDVTAAKPGKIVSIITRNGVPKVQVGDDVNTGDILVSGRLEVLNDNKEVTAYQYRVSDSDIYAQTTNEYNCEMPLSYAKKNFSGKKKQLFFVKFGKYTFSLGGLNNHYKESEQTTNETQLKIGEHFYLPISYGKKVVRQYTSKKVVYSKKEIQEKLTTEFEAYCNELKEQNVQIVEENVKIEKSKENAIAKGTLTLIEPIGIYQKTEIVELPTIENNGRMDED